MRTLTPELLGAVLARETGKVAVFLLTVTHPDMETIRLSTDPTQRLSIDPLYYGTVSRGREYLYIGMQVTIPDEKDRTPPTSRLTIFDVDQEVITKARIVTRPPPRVLMEVVLADTPDIVEIPIPRLELRNGQHAGGSITFECSIDLLINEQFPIGKFIPAHFSGLF